MHCLVEKAPRRWCITFSDQSKNDGLALLADRVVKVFRCAVHLDICFIHPPASANPILVVPEYLFQHGIRPLSKRVSLLPSDNSLVNATEPIFWPTSLHAEAKKVLAKWLGHHSK